MKEYLSYEELRERLLWLVRLRWFAVTGVVTLSPLLKWTGLLSYPLLPPFIIAGSVALYNMIFYLLLKRESPLRKIALLQVLLDQLGLSMGVYFSGGCDSPFIYFFIFHVVISAMVMPGLWPYVFATTGILYPLSVMALKNLGILPHFGILSQEPVIFSDVKVMAVYGMGFIITMYLTAYISNYLSRGLLISRLKLRDSNLRLSSLLDASRLSHSTLELEQILSTSLRIILNSTNLKAGIILLAEEQTPARCYEYFNCNAYNCPAHKADINCWRLEGTMCHGDEMSCPFGLDGFKCWKENSLHTHFIPLKDESQRIQACSNCAYFLCVVLQPRLVAGFKNGEFLKQKADLDGESLRKALKMGRVIADYSKDNPFGLPLEPATTLIIPLIVQKEIMGVFYLVSDQEIQYIPENLEFFQLLSEILTSAIFNSRLYTEVESSYLATILAIANALEAKDPYTRGHSERVAKLCIELGDALGLSEQEKEHLKFAAILHDVGKIGISRELLSKHCSLDECEAEEIKLHPVHGVKILEPIPFLKPVLSAIKYHHENYDGTGYPEGLKGKDIPFKARLLKIADAWDAMRSDRPYRKALSKEEAITEMLRNKGTQFDPDIVDVFVTKVIG